MPKTQDPSEVIQTSITMERQLKDKYSKLACQMDLSFSQLVRYALKQVEHGFEDYSSILSRDSEHSKLILKAGSKYENLR